MTPAIKIVRGKIRRGEIAALAKEQFGDMVKAVVDIRRSIMAIGGELHSDEEAALLEDGSRQSDLWGINLYSDEPEESWIEYDSMINVRPSSGNRSRSVENETVRESIRRAVESLLAD